VKNVWNSEKKVASGWKKVHSEEVHSSYTLPNIIRMRWLGE
jgi:hypothetical protein